MTPAEHIAQAESILAWAGDRDNGLLSGEIIDQANLAIAHALLAIAVELGVPHPAAAPGGPSAG